MSLDKNQTVVEEMNYLLPTPQKNRYWWFNEGSEERNKYFKLITVTEVFHGKKKNLLYTEVLA